MSLLSLENIVIQRSPTPPSHFEGPSADPPHPSRILATILCGATVLRLISIFTLRTYLNPATWEFGILAHTMKAGHGYTIIFRDGVRIPSAYMPPFYPYLLAASWKMFGESDHTYRLIELLQALLGVLLVLYIYRLATLLFSSRVALTAGGLIAVWPTFIYLCNEFHSINLYILLGVAAVYYLVHYVEVSRSSGDAACLGLCMGGLFYCRAETSSLLAVYVLVMIWRCGRRSLGHATVVVIIALLCISPWTIRNYRVFGHLVLVATSAGNNLWIGHNPHALGNSTWDPLFPTPDQRKTMAALTVKRDGEVLIDRQATAYAWEFARDHPQQEVSLTARKIFYFLLFDPSHKKGSKIAYWGPSLLLLLLALSGAWLHRDRLLMQELPVTATVAFAFFLSLAVFALPRYRIAIDPFLAMYAAAALVPGFLTMKKAFRSFSRVPLVHSSHDLYR